MRRFVKYLLIAVALVCVVTVGASYFFKRRAEAYVSEIIVQAAKKAKINLALQDLKLYPFGASASAVNLFLPQYLLSLALEAASVDLSVFSLLKRRPRVDFSGRFFQSSLEGIADFDIADEELSGELAIERLELKNIPQLAIIGAKSGIIRFKLSDIVFKEGVLQQLYGNLTLEDLSTSRITRIDNITVPQIADLDVRAEMKYQDRILSASAISESEFGQVTYEASFLPANRFLTLEARIRLTEEGTKHFGYLLPQISNNILSVTQKEFDIAAEGPVRDMSYRFVPLK